MIFFIGCQHETPTVENKPSNDGWKLEYFHKVKIQSQRATNLKVRALQV